MGDRTVPLVVLLAERFEWRMALSVAVGLGILAAWTWRNLVVGAFAELSGASWLVYGYVALTGGTPFLLLPFVAAHDWPTVEVILRGLGLALIGLKLAGACVLIPILWRRGILTAPALAAAVAAWTIIAAGLASTIHFLWPEFYRLLDIFGFGPAGDLVTPRVAAALIAIYLPLNRLLAAPLALQTNRVR